MRYFTNGCSRQELYSECLHDSGIGLCERGYCNYLPCYDASLANANLKELTERLSGVQYQKGKYCFPI